MRSLFRINFINWNEVNQFAAGYLESNKTVVFNYIQEHKKLEAGKELAKIMAGFEGALPDTYGKSAE